MAGTTVHFFATNSPCPSITFTAFFVLAQQSLLLVF
jgi:hypothetical protein